MFIGVFVPIVFVALSCGRRGDGEHGNHQKCCSFEHSTPPVHIQLQRVCGGLCHKFSNWSWARTPALKTVGATHPGFWKSSARGLDARGASGILEGERRAERVVE